MSGEGADRAAGPAAEEEGPRRRRRWIALVVLVLLIAAGLAAAVRLSALLSPLGDSRTPVADVASERLLPLGPVVGFAADADTHAWLGLPFARPPTAERRWRGPRPPVAWAETFDALRPGPPCPQVGSRLGGVLGERDGGFAGEEDCLYLNVWAPRVDGDAVPTGDARWPVMVWIHGGGNTRGYAAARMYDGALLAGRGQVVVVSIAYRLGPLGFFSHPALRAESDDALEASGNFGLLDQIRALEWVRTHVEEFGGDPENVTIFGESAGALDVYALLLSDAASGLFHRAIAQSGVLRSVSREEAESAARGPDGAPGSAMAVAALLAESGVVPDRDAALGYAEALASADLLDFLRGRTPDEILSVYRDPAQPAAIRVPQPIRDGALLPDEEWLGAFRAGRFTRVPVLAGANRDEMKLYLSQDPEHVRQRFGVFYRILDAPDYERRARLHSDWWMLTGVVEPLEAMAEAGHAETWAYRFEWDALSPVLGQQMGAIVGAGHGFELPLLFGRFDLGDPLLSRLLYADAGRVSREALSLRMMGYWAEFARAGRPGLGGDPAGPRWETWRTSAVPVEASALANEGAVPFAGGSPAPEFASPPPRWMVLDGAEDGGIRMAPASVTRAGLEAAVANDRTLSRDGKCALLRDLLAQHERLTSGSIAAASDGRCDLAK